MTFLLVCTDASQSYIYLHAHPAADVTCQYNHVLTTEQEGSLCKPINLRWPLAYSMFSVWLIITAG